MVSNVLRCEKCGLDVIEEEYLIHVCKKVIEYKIKDNILWIFDGEKWIPRKLIKSPTENKQNKNSPTDFQQRNKTTDDETEPIFLISLFTGLDCIGCCSVEPVNAKRPENIVRLPLGFEYSLMWYIF